jgi:hypothetical protein
MEYTWYIPTIYLVGVPDNDMTTVTFRVVWTGLPDNVNSAGAAELRCRPHQADWDAAADRAPAVAADLQCRAASPTARYSTLQATRSVGTRCLRSKYRLVTVDQP